MRKHLQREINVMDTKTSPSELIIESITNFIWGFAGNSIVVFMAKERFRMIQFYDYQYYDMSKDSSLVQLKRELIISSL